MDGFININKPAGMTSNDVVVRVRRRLREISGDKKIKVGHLGTLDPAAEGVLVVAFGRATKLFDAFLDKKKRYAAEFTFGAETDTLDRDGKILSEGGAIPGIDALREAAKKLTGEVWQTPPLYSAKSVNGKKAYDMARRGEAFELPPKRVVINDIEILSIEGDKAVVIVDCLGGVYIRSIARDLAALCGTTAYMSALRRLEAGVFKLSESITLDAFMSLANDGIESPGNAVLLPLEYISKTPSVLPFFSDKPVVACGEGKSLIVTLGYMDCVHIGHARLLNAAKTAADIANGYADFGGGQPERSEKTVYTAAFTFLNSPFAVIGRDTLPIYGFETRLKLFDCDFVISAEFDLGFKALSGRGFLDALLKTGDIKGVVAGKDYRFSENAACGTEFLEEYLKEKGIPLTVVDTVLDCGGQKASSSKIREYLTDGDVARANALLCRRYRVSGEVIRGTQTGSKIGFPTANLRPEEGTVRLKEGVYLTKTRLAGKTYDSLTNVGGRPTFDACGEYLYETYISGLNRPLYGERIEVEFIDRLRDIIKFDSLGKLTEQLEKDKRLLPGQ
ncbi:MAG: tRNA pseudouridine(55) synthase TruB [Clostridiales bacterium]|nr:tRNA pseudouridine(55) synthase TruB [Clostridiales bacterium]